MQQGHSSIRSIERRRTYRSSKITSSSQKLPAALKLRPRRVAMLVVMAWAMAWLVTAAVATSAVATQFELPPFSWDTIPRFVHCGPDYKPDQPGHPPRLPLREVYKRMSTYPLATLEKFTLQTEAPANVHEEAKILEAAKAIKSHNTSTKVIFYHMVSAVGSQRLLARAGLTHSSDPPGAEIDIDIAGRRGKTSRSTTCTTRRARTPTATGPSRGTMAPFLESTTGNACTATGAATSALITSRTPV
eukprot:SAG31_NODE_4874_length_2892_cov_3.716076_1_plen_246_part_00